jgi:hypothetical protein
VRRWLSTPVIQREVRWAEIGERDNDPLRGQSFCDGFGSGDNCCGSGGSRRGDTEAQVVATRLADARSEMEAN